MFDLHEWPMLFYSGWFWLALIVNSAFGIIAGWSMCGILASTDADDAVDVAVDELQALRTSREEVLRLQERIRVLQQMNLDLHLALEQGNSND